MYIINTGNGMAVKIANLHSHNFSNYKSATIILDKALFVRYKTNICLGGLCGENINLN